MEVIEFRDVFKDVLRPGCDAVFTGCLLNILGFTIYNLLKALHRDQSI